MATTTPVLATYTLPEPAYPDGYTEELTWRGASSEMADGSVVWDLADTDGKRDFTLKWVGLSSSQKVTIDTAYTAIKSSYSASNFTAPTGSTYTVTRNPAQDSLEWKATMQAGNTLVWSTVMKLRSV